MVDAYEALQAGFRWRVPAGFGLADACCGRWARRTPDAVAIRTEPSDGPPADRTYGELQAAANRLSSVLRRSGVERGDRVAIVLPQCFETAVSHVALWQLGAVGVPLTQLFGPEALEFRLNDSEARIAIADAASVGRLRAIRSTCPHLETLLTVDVATAPGELDWRAECGRAVATFDAAGTSADDPAVLIYTSGTTGPPQGRADSAPGAAR